MKKYNVIYREFITLILSIGITISITILILFIIMITGPKKVNVEYFEDDNSIISEIREGYEGKAKTENVYVNTKCGIMSMDDRYFKYYQYKPGTSVTTKFEKVYYDNGKTYIRIYDIIKN